MARRVVILEEKIEKVQINVAETKVKYDKAVDELEKLLMKRKKRDNKQLLKAFSESEKTLAEVIEFLQGKYRGITVLLEIEEAQKTLDTGFQQGHINLQQIRDVLCGDGRSLLIKSKHEIDHIFSELYRVDERIRIPYFWIKVIELLLFLSLLDASYVKKPRQFSEDVSKGTQQAYQYIIENPFSKITISQLAEMFHVAESSMKRCFTSIAGNSIGTFMKIKRMEAAALLLVSEPQLSICEVAEAAGYENQSKFSAAFKSIMGVTPFAYRCKSW